MNVDDCADDTADSDSRGEAALTDALGVSGGLVADTEAVESVEVTVPADAAPIERLSSILAAVGDGPHSGAVVEFARAIAAASDAWMDLFYVVDEARSERDGDRLLDAADDRLSDFDRVGRWVLEANSPAGGILEQSAYYDAVLLGAPTSGRVERFVLGSTTATVVENAACPVVVVTADGSRYLSRE